MTKEEFDKLNRPGVTLDMTNASPELKASIEIIQGNLIDNSSSDH